MYNKEKLISVHSLKLLKALEQNRCMGLLHKMKLGNEVIDGVRYPVYFFYAKPDVMDIKQKFENQYGKDSAKLDDPKEWIGYKESNIEDNNVKTVTTNNYYCIARLFDEGYANQLIAVSKSKYGQRIFVFAYNSEIERIKHDMKEKARQIYAEKHKDD